MNLQHREAHLATFLAVMHPFLQSHNISYTVLVINQTGDGPFLRGLLFNVGVAESVRLLPHPPDCLVLHDVDHLPQETTWHFNFGIFSPYFASLRIMFPFLKGPCP